MNVASLLTRHPAKELAKISDPARVALESIRVASPCPASWEHMAGDDRVRHCQDCELNVYNLSEMTRSEAERLIASHEGSLCVRFYRRADGTVLTRDCPKGLQALIRHVSRVAGAALSAMITLTFGAAQVCPQSAAQTASPSMQRLGDLDVRVTDPTGGVIAGAQVILTSEKGQQIKQFTDSNGQAHFSNLSAGSYTVLASARYFKDIRQTAKVQKGTKTKLATTLRWAATLGRFIEADASWF